MFASRQKIRMGFTTGGYATPRRNGKHYARRHPARKAKREWRFPLPAGLDWRTLRFNMPRMSLRLPKAEAADISCGTLRRMPDRSFAQAVKAGAIKWPIVLTLVLAVSMVPGESRDLEQSSQGLALNSGQIAEAVGTAIRAETYPAVATMPVDGKSINVQLKYSFNPVIQTAADSIFARYKPDFGAFAAIEPETGRVLALSSYIKGGEDLGNLALRATFPAASIFKTVTAAAALDQKKLNPDSVIPFNGKSSTLYKRHVLHHKNNKWTRRPTLKEAFAKSINPVFARIGVYTVGGEILKKYAEKFGFNQNVESDFSFDSGNIQIDPHNDWNIAETASGFTRKDTLSPLHGAMLAATIVNDGVMMRPFIVQSGKTEEGMLLYQPKSQRIETPITVHTARAMRKLMRQTVKSGTAKKSFRRFLAKRNGLDVGGKTGSLTGLNPKGKTDWFIGYAEKDGKKIAYAALTVNKKKWTVKSHYVARKVLESWLADNKLVKTKVANGN